MATKKEKFDYLDEHLPYMLGSTRYDFEKLTQPLFFRDWNASFQSFSVNARNLVEFLTNGDKGNFKASDFTEGFRCRKGDIQGPMRKLDEQVFHLGKSRPRDGTGKFNLAAAKEVLDWIEQGMTEFIQKLATKDREAWNAKKADPQFDEVVPSKGWTGPGSPQSASSSIVSTTHTSVPPSELKVVGNLNDGK
jgi:hypothetical protein